LTPAELFNLVRSQKLGVLGCLGPDNTPQSALVGIAITSQLEIVFDTVRNSRKYANLVARPACSFVIGGWDSGEQTVQYEGVAEELRSPALERFQEIYFGVYPDGRSRLAWPGIVHFLVRPRWIRYSDFDRRPPMIAELSF